MSAPLIQFDQPTREEWLELRKRGLGATDISAVIGLNPYRSPIEVWLEKTGQGGAVPDSLRMELGLFMEPKLTALYERKTGATLREFPGLLAQHPRESWALASPDRLVVGKDQIVELKMVGDRMADKWGEEGTDEVPDYYLIQVQYQMVVTAIPVADFSVLIGNSRHAIYHTEAHPDLQRMMMEEGRRFWVDHVLPRRMPPVDFGKLKPEILSAIYRTHGEALAQATPAVEALVGMFCEQVRALDAMERAVEALENEIKATIGENAGIQGDGWKITWKKAKDATKTDWKAIAQALNPPQEIIRQHTETKEGSRRFLHPFLKTQKEG